MKWSMNAMNAINAMGESEQQGNPGHTGTTSAPIREEVVGFGAVLKGLLRALDDTLELQGWDLPARLAEVHLDPFGGAFALSIVPIAELSGHPTCELMRLRPLASAEAIGVVLITEGWGYSPASNARIAAGESLRFAPSQDPDRIEVRITNLVLRDGTERMLSRVRGTTDVVTEERAHAGWVPELARRCLMLPSKAKSPPDSFPRELTITWQILATAALIFPLLKEAGNGVDMNFDSLAPIPEVWGQAILPLADVEESAMESLLVGDWWPPIKAALGGAPLDIPALARALRGALTEGNRPLPLIAPLIRGDEMVLMDKALANWLDDPLLVSFCYQVTPNRSWLRNILESEFGPSWAESFDIFCQENPEVE